MISGLDFSQVVVAGIVDVIVVRAAAPVEVDVMVEVRVVREQLEMVEVIVVVEGRVVV